MAKSQAGRRRSRARGTDAKPLSPDELLQRDDLPPSRDVPEEVSSGLERRRLFLTGMPRTVAVDRVAPGGPRGGYSIDLPKHAVVGLPGRTAYRMRRPPRRSSRVALDSHRPAWVKHVYHPKRATVPTWARHPATIGGRSGEVYYGVFPPEDRAVYYPSGYPWQCIGRVYAWNDASASSWSWSGSAVLIGPRLALTAGHVVPWDATTWMMRFVPAYYDGASLLGGGAESYVSDARGWDVSYYSRMPDAHDMAILRLYEPLGDWIGYFGSKPYDSSYNGHPYWNLTGYPSAIANAERPSYQLGITVNEADASGDALDLEHQGDSTPGDSGGPFWGTWPDGFPYVVGTVSGGEVFTNSKGDVTKDTNNCAGGNAINDLIRWGRTNWP